MRVLVGGQLLDYDLLYILSWTSERRVSSLYNLHRYTKAGLTL